MARFGIKIRLIRWLWHTIFIKCGWIIGPKNHVSLVRVQSSIYKFFKVFINILYPYMRNDVITADFLNEYDEIHVGQWMWGYVLLTFKLKICAIFLIKSLFSQQFDFYIKSKVLTFSKSNKSVLLVLWMDWHPAAKRLSPEFSCVTATNTVSLVGCFSSGKRG